MKHNRTAFNSAGIACVSLMLLITLVTPAFIYAVPQEKTGITAGNVFPGEVAMKAFSLSKDGKVKLDGALGLFLDKGTELVFYGWILDSNTRKVVWHMLTERKEFERGLNDIKETIPLPKGDYELYYAAALNHSEHVGESPNLVSRILSSIFDLDKKRYSHTYRDQLKLTVSGAGSDMTEANPIELVNRQGKNAIISILRSPNESRIQKAFALAKKINVRIYAVGEGRRETTYDYAWIDDIVNNKRIWTMNERDIKAAGGADKNILVDEVITLPAGKYLVHYTTDASHSYEGWNSLPPDDPQSWGITIRPVNENELADATPIQDFQLPKPVLELIKVKDDETVSMGVILDKPMALRVLCVGEGEAHGEMSDYGWIAKADTGAKVWEMSGRGNQHAGGAGKNRMIDEVIHLDKGDYVVNYVTDDSHSYNDWNAAAPFEPERWGITLWVTAENDRDSIRLVRELR